MRQRFVLDTTAITDSALREKEHYSSICESANEILDLIALARLKLDISCYHLKACPSGRGWQERLIKALVASNQ
jgi:predicted DNA-binding protein (UPF0278 family)